MKNTAKLLCILLISILLCSCAFPAPAQVAATTLPVYEFTLAICQDTPITVTRLITEEVSCVHDYTLTVNQMRAIEGAELVVLSGAGLEEFMEEALDSAACVADASAGIELLEGSCHHHGEEAEEEYEEEHHHSHEADPHIWLDPHNAAAMARNILRALSARYPEHADRFEANARNLLARIEAVESYGLEQLAGLTVRELITFHDGFGYLAHAFDLHILEAIEEESGSESSALELIDLIGIVEHHGVTAIFTETNGSDSAASVIAAETGVQIYTLDMAMSGSGWFDSMYHNIDTLKEALS